MFTAWLPTGKGSTGSHGAKAVSRWLTQPLLVTGFLV